VEAARQHHERVPDLELGVDGLIFVGGAFSVVPEVGSWDEASCSWERQMRTKGKEGRLTILLGGLLAGHKKSNPRVATHLVFDHGSMVLVVVGIVTV
jgi:hypothetical protein